MRARLANSLIKQSRGRIWLAVAGVHLATTLALIFWWGHLLNDQATIIASLQSQLGQSASTVQSTFERTARMIQFEALWFLAVVLCSAVFLLVIYLRDWRRTRMLQSFFASLTHELKTPLTSVRLQAESIAEAGSDGEYQQALILRLLQDTARLETQVERALELARVEGGGGLSCRPLALRQLVERSVNAWRGHGDDRMIIRTAEIDENSVVIADPNAFHTILKNLFENSLRHGGRDKVEVDLGIRCDDRHVFIDYRDNGSGSSLPVRRLGQLFVRGAESSGAGVGLYLVRALMKHMAGDVAFRGQANFFGCELRFVKGEQG
jgi:signal transduction histidine kinase